MPPTSPRNAGRLIDNFGRATTAPLIDISLRLDGVAPAGARPLLRWWEHGIVGRAIELALRNSSSADHTTCYVARAIPARFAYLDLAHTVRRWVFRLAEDPRVSHRWYLYATDDLARCMRDELERGAEVYLPGECRYLKLRDMHAHGFVAVG